MERKRDTGERLDALVKGADSSSRQTKSRCFQRLPELRGRDSNPNFLIQSQASYR
jgi:hypothetical protein